MESVIRMADELSEICSCTWVGDQRTQGIDCPVHCSPDDPNADHDWERDEYDPSVGMMSSGRTCASCGRFEFVDYEDSGDDY